MIASAARADSLVQIRAGEGEVAAGEPVRLRYLGCAARHGSLLGGQRLALRG